MDSRRSQTESIGIGVCERGKGEEKTFTLRNFKDIGAREKYCYGCENEVTDRLEYWMFVSAVVVFTVEDTVSDLIQL